MTSKVELNTGSLIHTKIKALLFFRAVSDSAALPNKADFDFLA